jgi:hypothetical protein
MKNVYVATDYHEKQLQRALLQYNRPQNADLVREALTKAGRTDLIGHTPDCLVRPANTHAPKKDGGKKPTAPQKGNKKAPQRDAKGAKTAPRGAKTPARLTQKTGAKKSVQGKKKR